MGLRKWLARRRYAPAPVENGDFACWFADKEFSADWTSHLFPTWKRVLGPVRSEIVRILEIGSFEGRSAIFFLRFFPAASVTSIDPFAGSATNVETDPPTRKLVEAEARFDRNVAAFGDRIRKIRGRSAPELESLIQSGEVFDLVYIDGDHKRDAVLIDSLLAWQALRPGGILIWDDYEWHPKLPLDQRPKQAIDVFLALHAGELSTLHRGYQMIVRRLASAG